ncbi:MAG: alpha-glucan family phosphorylase [Acidobacteriota bacterium]
MNPSQSPIVLPSLHVADIELPREVEKLYDLSYNLWWTWNRPARMLFTAVDALTWARYRNPIQLLINVEPTHWQTLLETESFMRLYKQVLGEFESYMEGAAGCWFRRRAPEYDRGPMAYFSMEFGVSQSLAIYSGGLGVLAGDHLKAASDLGLPFVGVGLLYRHGYFHQTVDADGRQQHTYPEYDFNRLPLRPVATHTGREVIARVPLPGREVAVKAWVAQIGRVPLLLLDTDIPQNEPADRPIAGMLYTRGREMRLVQELVLGIGGVRILRALGIEPAVWHMNEGHSGFLQLERVRELVEEKRVPFADAHRAVGKSAVFTTHTPVPAGNEQFDPQLVRPYLDVYAERVGATTDELLRLGNADHGEAGQNFNLTAWALRASSFANGVSRLNAEVTSRMWRHLFPDVPASEAVIQPITNGVHPQTWIGPDILELLIRYLGPGWRDLPLSREDWEKVYDIPDDELWTAHMAQSERLGRFLRSRLRDQFARLGSPPDELRGIDALFQADALTIGFARRFATYKRASLIFTDLQRLKTLLGDPARPVQILFAGKAHPADRPGQEMIQHIFQLSQEDRFRGKVFFVEDYDMRVAGRLVQGVDVWLNTPRRPMEASGTSGQKAAMNGALNCSVLDGWWPEGYDGQNGWVIGGLGGVYDEAIQDRDDALSLYQTLEEQIVPLYYERDEHALPRRWIAMMKRSIATLTAQFSSTRMVRDYVEQAYLPVALGGQG